ncbi:hypothetical protein AB0L57_20490 [Nocardia sp. NPDC052254]|uniref:hypothetical protein n=1 Tax=Nocardia sp. NPDC052254 TaxID=3155681 RepID=UPI00342577C9
MTETGPHTEMITMKKHAHRRPTASPDPAHIVQRRRIREILNHFRPCPECGYTTQAFLVTTYYGNDTTVTTTEGACGLPCGWSGPIVVTKMTKDSA